MSVFFFNAISFCLSFHQNITETSLVKLTSTSSLHCVVYVVFNFRLMRVCTFFNERGNAPADLKDLSYLVDTLWLKDEATGSHL